MVSKILFLIMILSFTSCDSTNLVYQAEGTFINSNNLKIGSVEVVEQGKGSNFRIHLETLKPGFYAMHIHQVGKCNPPEFTSSSGHHGMKAGGTFYGDFKPIYVKNEVSKYTGKLKKFGQIIFLKDIYLNPSSELTILDSNGSSIIIHESSEGGRRIACAEINRKL